LVTAREEGGKMWEMYAEEAEKYNKAVTDAQKDDADGVLVFVGYNLLSVEVTATDWL
jgi:hypothetical protein